MLDQFLDSSYVFQSLCVLSLGAILGSFINVVILRLPRGRSIVYPSSRCSKCGSPVSAWMNFPVISFLISGGMCSVCQWPYSSRYMWIEVICASLIFGLWSIYFWSTEFFIYSLFSLALVTITFIDIDIKIIPDEISIGGWVLALLLAFIGGSRFVIGFEESLYASLMGFFIFWVIAKLYYGIRGEHGLGGGDLKLMGLIGAVTGYQGVFTTILVGSLLGMILGILMVRFADKSFKYAFPFGPSLAIGALVHVFRLDELIWLNDIDL